MNQQQSDNPDVQLGPILEYAFKLYQVNFMYFFTIGLMYAFANVLEGLISNVLQTKPNTLFFFVTIMISNWISIALIHSAAMAYKGSEASMRKAFLRAGGIFWLFMAVTLSTVVIVICGFFMLILPGLYLMTIFLFTDVLVVLEKVDFMGAFKRSVQIVRTNFWKVFQFNVVMVILLGIPGLLGEYLFQSKIAYGRTLVSFLIAAIMPFYMIAQVGLYNRLKNRPEVLDMDSVA